MSGHGQLILTIHRARNLLPCDINGLSDPFVTITFGTQTAKTTTKDATLTPTWGETFAFHTTKETASVTLEVYDSDMMKNLALGMMKNADFMGHCTLSFGSSLFDDIGEGWVSLQGKTQMDYQNAREKNGVHCFGEIYLQWWFSYSQHGRLLMPGGMGWTNKGLVGLEEDKPVFEMDTMKEGINRASNALYYLCVPYWWLMSHFCWENVVESAVYLSFIVWLFWIDKLHILLPFTLACCMVTNYYRFYRYGPDGAPTNDRPYSTLETIDWYKDTLHKVQINCGYFSDLFDTVNDILYWYKPETTQYLFYGSLTVVSLYAIGAFPSVRVVSFLTLLYLFTLYPLAYYFPVAYAKLMRGERIEPESISTEPSPAPDTPKNGLPTPFRESHGKGLIEFTNLPSDPPTVSWKEKMKVDKCFGCHAVFSLLLTRKHCRCCGEIFCKRCTPLFDIRPYSSFARWTYNQSQRVCTVCRVMVTKHNILFRQGIKVDVWWGDQLRLRGALLLLEEWRPVSGTTRLRIGKTVCITRKEMRIFSHAGKARMYVIETDTLTYNFEVKDPRDCAHMDGLQTLLM